MIKISAKKNTRTKKVPTVLKVSYPENCIRCELCIMESQRQLGKAGMEGSLIRISSNENGYSVQLDPMVNKLEIKRIMSICPTAVFTLEEESGEDELLK